MTLVSVRSPLNLYLRIGASCKLPPRWSGAASPLIRRLALVSVPVSGSPRLRWVRLQVSRASSCSALFSLFSFSFSLFHDLYIDHIVSLSNHIVSNIDHNVVICLCYKMCYMSPMAKKSSSRRPKGAPQFEMKFDLRITRDLFDRIENLRITSPDVVPTSAQKYRDLLEKAVSQEERDRARIPI